MSASVPGSGGTGSYRTRTERLEARITAEQKKLFKKAAALMGRSVSDFVVSSAHEAAVRTIERVEIMTLDQTDSEIFVEALLNPSAPSRTLRKAAERYRKTIAE